MFKYLPFSFGIFFIGFIVAAIAFVIIILSVKVFDGKRAHTPVSYFVAVLFSIVLLVLNVSFCGLVHKSNLIEEYRYSVEYNLINNGVDLLSTYNADLGNIASSLLGENISEQVIERELDEINKYLWINGVLCVLVFAFGVLSTYMATNKGGARGNRGYRREHEHAARHRHRSEY